MPLNLFVLCGPTGEPTVKRVQVTQEVQGQLDLWFDIAETRFRDGIDHEVDFDGRWKPDDDESMRLPFTDEAQAIGQTLNADALAVESIDPQGFDDEAIRSLLVRKTAGQHSRILLQAFSNMQRLHRKFSLTLHEGIFNRLSQPTFAIDTQIHVILEGGFIKFRSYNMAKRVLDLTGAYKEATDQDILELFNQATVTGDPQGVIETANPMLRKLIASIKDSSVFQDNTAAQIQAKAHAVNFDIPIENDRVVLPSDRKELKKVLTFLDHGVYLSPVNQARYITNSRRALP